MNISQSLLIIAAACAFATAQAQTLSFEPMPLDRPLLEISLIHGFYSNANLRDAAGLGVINLHANLPVGARTNVDVLLPISSVNNTHNADIFGSGSGNISSTQLGNIGAAIQLATDDARHSVITLGFEAPTASSEYFALFPIYDNWTNLDHYISNALTFRAAYSGRYVTPSGLFLGGQLEPRVVVPTGSGDGNGVWLGDVGVSAGYENNVAAVMVEFENLFNLTYTENPTFNALSIGGQFKGDHLRGTLYLQVPVNQEWSNVVSPIVGLKFGYVL